MNRKTCLFILSTLLWSCDLKKELDIQDIDIEQRYFLECYMRPGELFNLTATEISPIFEAYILDYSLDFDVYVIDIDTIELFQSLFIEAGTGFIYNYGSGLRLDENSESVSLFVLGPNGDTLTGFSRIPEQVSMVSAEVLDENVKVSFMTSELSIDNFYIAIVNYNIEVTEEDITNKNEKRYLDFSSISEISETEFSIKVDSLEFTQAINVSILRVTEENFRYQRSLDDAKNAGRDNVTFPAPLEGNIQNGVGIFTCYTEDVRQISLSDNAE